MWILRALLILWLVVHTSQSQGSSLLLENLKTSDDIYLRGGRAQHFFSERKWKLGYVEQELDFRRDVGLKKSALHKFELGHQVNLSDADQLLLNLSHLWIENPLHNRQTLMGSIDYKKQWEQAEIRVLLEKQSLAEVLRSTSSQGALVNEFRKTVFATYQWTPNWKSKIALGQTHLNDENRAIFYDLSASYGISAGWPWIWLGYGMEGLSFERLGAGYWSPDRFTNHGPRLDSSFPLWGAVSGIFALNLNFFKENSLSGEGYLGAAGLQWGPFDGNHVRLVYTKIKSSQNQTAWIYEGLQLTCNIISF